MHKLFLIAFIFGSTVMSAELPVLKSADGEWVKPFNDLGEKKAAVFVFVMHDCPISNAYAPELERIRMAYAEKGFAFYLIQTDPALTAADALKHSVEYKLQFKVLMDGGHELSALCGAKTVPEVAVMGKDGRALYLGRIDDLFADYGKRRAQATAHDLRNALDAIANGLPAPKAGGPAIGCLIPENRSEKAEKKP